MNTDPFTVAARAEAKDRWWNGAVPKDVNPPEAWILGFQEGAPWARAYLAEQEPTDAEVLAALEAFDGFNVQTWGTAPMSPRTSLDQHMPLHVERMRAVLRDARTARRDEEKQ